MKFATERRKGSAQRVSMFSRVVHRHRRDYHRTGKGFHACESTIVPLGPEPALNVHSGLVLVRVMVRFSPCAKSLRKIVNPCKMSTSPCKSCQVLLTPCKHHYSV